MNPEQLERYADLLLDAGVNLVEGQNLLIRADPIHRPFVSMLERAAYERGARFVRCDLDHPASIVNRVGAQKEEFLDYIPSYQESFLQAVLDEHWSLIKLDGMADPAIFDGLDQRRNAILQKAMRRTAQPLTAAFTSGEKSWLVSPMPTPGWAAKVLGGEADEANAQRLWEIFVPFLRLDTEDPVAAWKTHGEVLRRRCDVLDQSELQSLHLKSPETDLTVHLTPLSTWAGGGMESKANGWFFPNLPTEEVFTTPDFRLTEGTVAVTRPLRVLNAIVTGARFEFRAGEIVEHHADVGKDALDAFLEMDPRASFLGEIALVGADSPLFTSGLLFDDVVLDENAASHIALGFGYPPTLRGGTAMTDEELLEHGCNRSMLHLDFMIGAPDMDVTGKTADGFAVPVMRDGVFVI